MSKTPHQQLLDSAVGTEKLAPICQLLGIRLLEWSKGEARLEMDVKPGHINAIGTVHGGIFCDLADVAFGCAFASVLGAAEAMTTVDLHMSYLKSVKDGRLEARAQVIRKGRRSGYLECEVRNDDGELVAKGTTTYLVVAP